MTAYDRRVLPLLTSLALDQDPLIPPRPPPSAKRTAVPQSLEAKSKLRFKL